MGIEFGKYGMPGSGKYSQLSRTDPNAPLPPGLVSLEIAYTGGSNITVLDGKPVNIIDTLSNTALNVDSGSKKLYSVYNAEIRGGVTSHLLNQPITGDLGVTQNVLDRVNVNYDAADYLYTLPLNDSFPDGSQFELMQFAAGGSITLFAPSGVFLNGQTDISILLTTPFQRAIFRRIEQNQWTAFTVGIPQTPVYGQYTASIELLNGLTSATMYAGLYSGPSNSVGSNIMVTTVIGVTTGPDMSTELCSMRIPLPISTVFTDSRQALVNGNLAIVSAEGVPGNTGNGWHNDLFADTDNGAVIFNFEASQPNFNYALSFSFTYSLQATLLKNKKRLHRV